MVRESLEAFNRRDLSKLFARIDPQVEWVPLDEMLDGETYAGHDGVRRFIDDMERDMAGFTVRTDDIVEGREDSVVIVGSVLGTGRGSGMELEFPLGWVIRVRDERVIYLRAYSDRQRAFADAGIAPPAPRYGA